MSCARSLEPVACAEHEEKLIYDIRKRQITEDEPNLGKMFPKYKTGAYSALRHKATVDWSQTWKPEPILQGHNVQGRILFIILLFSILSSTHICPLLRTSSKSGIARFEAWLEEALCRIRYKQNRRTLWLPSYLITFLKSAVNVFDCCNVCSGTCVEVAVLRLFVVLPQQFALRRHRGQRPFL